MSFWGGVNEKGEHELGTAGGLGIFFLLLSLALHLLERQVKRQNPDAQEEVPAVDAHGRPTLRALVQHVGGRWYDLFKSAFGSVKK